MGPADGDGALGGGLGAAESIAELVRTAEEIRVHGVGREEKSRLRREAERIARWVSRLNFVAPAVGQGYQAVALLLLVGALFVVYRIGSTNPAGLGAVVLILLRSFAYTQQLQSSYHLVMANTPSIERAREQQEAYRERVARFGERPLRKIRSVALDGVSYSYETSGRVRPALKAVSFSARSGEVIGVVGPSGAGKSTLVQILLRLRAPDTGRYLIDTFDAADYAPDDWTRLVSYVPQDPQLIAGTVADNIRFLRVDYSDADVETAAAKANLHDEIVRFPDGYATRIGQRADALSGGQRQRLCIARALLSSPQLLILDEPTSALDALSEQVIQRTLEGLRGQTLIVIIAHRLTTLRTCDRILVLCNGQVEATGTPELLARQGGFYRQVVATLGAAPAAG